MMTEEIPLLIILILFFVGIVSIVFLIFIHTKKRENKKDVIIRELQKEIEELKNKK